MAATSAGRVVLTFDVDDKGVVQGLGRVQGHVEKSTKTISTKAIAMGTAIGVAAGKLAVDAVKVLGREFVELATRGVKLAPLAASFDSLTRSIGESGDAMLSVSRGATKGLISDLDLMSAANKAIQLGLPVTTESFASMAEMATTLGRAMGQEATKSLDDLMVALGRSSPLILDNLGLTVKVGEANEAYARSIGKSANQLTDAEKKIAFYNAAIEAGQVAVDKLGGITLTLGDRIQIAQNWMKNFTDSLSVAVATSPVINAAFDAMGSALDGAIGESRTALVQKLIAHVNNLAISTAGVAQVLVQGAGYMVQGWHGVELVIKGTMLAVVALAEGSNRALLSFVETANKIPGLRGTYDGLIVTLQDATAQFSGMRESFQEQTAEAWEGVKGNSELGQTLGRLSETIATVKARMIEASRTQVDASTIEDMLRQKTENRTEAIVEATAASEASAKAADAERNALRGLGLILERDVNEQLDLFARAIERADSEGVPLNVTLNAMIPKLKELIAQAKASGINVDVLEQRLAEMRATVRDLNGTIPTLTARIMTLDEAHRTLAGAVGMVTAEQMAARTEASLLEGAYETLGIETSASLHNAANEARIAYERIRDSGLATEFELTQARQRLEQAEIDAGLRTVSLWETQISPAIQTAGRQIVDSMSVNFTDMLTGAASFKEGFTAIWGDLKNAVRGILDSMLKTFINEFLGGMLEALGSWARQAGQIMGSVFSMGSAGIGGLPVIPGLSAPAVGGGGAAATGGAAAGAGLAVGLTAASVAPIAIPWAMAALGPHGNDARASAQMEIDQLREGLAYQGISWEQAIEQGMLGGLSSTAMDILGLAQGGVVMPRPGGTIARIAEAGVPEAVIPLDGRHGLGGPTQIVLEIDRQRFWTAMLPGMRGSLERFRLA